MDRVTIHQLSRAVGFEVSVTLGVHSNSQVRWSLIPSLFDSNMGVFVITVGVSVSPLPSISPPQTPLLFRPGGLRPGDISSAVPYFSPALLCSHAGPVVDRQTQT